MNAKTLTVEQRVAILQAAIVRANLRAIGMQSENIQRVYLGQPITYHEDEFVAIISEEGVGEEQVRRWITGEIHEEATP